MGPLAMLRRHRRAVWIPVATWLLLQLVMATGVRAAAGPQPGAADAEALLLRDLATAICFGGQPTDSDHPLPTLHERCTWCMGFAHSLAPTPPTLRLPTLAPSIDASTPTVPVAAPRPLQRFVLFVTRAPPA
ncbi:MAG: hypothetical protein KDC18_06595 [Alphaproteobacteria bacterium]|nr:hypothetical protein [Alphaproteobacteria bacterium]